MASDRFERNDTRTSRTINDYWYGATTARCSVWGFRTRLTALDDTLVWTASGSSNLPWWCALSHHAVCTNVSIVEPLASVALCTSSCLRLSEDSKRSCGSIVLTLLGCLGDVEAGLAGWRTLQESFDLELQWGKGRTSCVGSKVVIKWLYFYSKVTIGSILLHRKCCQRYHPWVWAWTAAQASQFVGAHLPMHLQDLPLHLYHH